MRSAALGVALLVAVVSGCSADAKPAEVRPLASGTATAAPPTVSDAASPTTSASAARTSPATPALTSHPMTVEGASAFAREYVQLIGRGFSEADASLLRQRSAEGCEGCDRLMSAMDEASSAGLRRRGGEYSVASVATPPVEAGDVVLLLTYTRAASEIVDESGNIVERVEAVAATTVQMRLVFGPRGWLTQGYRVVPP